MFAVPVFTSLALCHQRAKTDNAKRWEWCCVLVFYGVVQFAIFSPCVVCCVALLHDVVHITKEEGRGEERDD